jgi:hypothetical protein
MSKRAVIAGTLVGISALMLLRDATGMTLETFTKLGWALSPIVTVCLALLALHVWRVQLVAKRRFEIAEAALSESQAAVYALEAIRNIGAFGTEGSMREKEKGETEEDTIRLNTAYVPIERINRYDDQFAALWKTIILAELHLGKEVAEAMRVFLGARNKVLIAARQLYRLRHPKLELTPDRQRRIEQYEAVIWQTRQDDPDDPLINDKLSKEIDAAMATIERVCRSALAVPKLRDSVRLVP